MKINKILESKKLKEGVTNTEPVVKFQGKSFYTFTKDKKWEVDFDEAGNILARTRHGKPYYFKGHINDKVNDFPSTDEDNIILAAREQHGLKFGKKTESFEKDGGPFWYLTKHGLGPGMLPKGANVVDTIEDDNFNTYIALDKVLSTQELKDYELKEKKPPIKEARRKASEEYIDDMKLTETYWINDKDIMNKVDELSNQLESEGWAHIEDKYTGSKYYAIFRRKGENGGEFKAVKYNYNHAPEIVDLTYDQIMGRVPLDSFDGLRKKLGKRLLPQNENYWFEDDGNFFNKEELVEFGEEIVDHLNEIFNSKWELTGAYEDGKEIEIEVSSDDVGTYVHSVKVDFRKIKKPSDINKYIMAFVAKFSEQIRKDMMLNESLGGKYAKKILEFAKRSLDNHYDITGILEIVLRYCPEDILKDAWYDKIRFLIDDTDDSDLLDDNDSKLIESASEDIPTETLAGPEEGPKAGLAELISMAIKDEWDAIETYNTLSITARAEGFEDIATISDEIGTEENKHVGQLQAALKTISPNAEAINVGEEEGNNQLEG